MGIEVSSGKFLAFVDSDDWWSETFLKDTVSNIKSFGGVSTEYYDVFEDSDKKVHVKASKHGVVSWEDVLKLKARFGNGNSLLRRKIVENYGIRFPEHLWYSEDIYFYTQYLSVIDRIYVVPSPDFYHLVRGASMVRSDKIKQESKIEQTIRVYEEVCTRIQEISKVSDEVCKLLKSYQMPYSIMTYITSVSDSLGRAEARKLFWKYLDYLKGYRLTRSHQSYLTLLWILDLFIPIRGILRRLIG